MVDQISEETYFWIVQLVCGSADEGGFIQETELVTNKYERVKGLTQKWEHLINSGKYFVCVSAVAIKEYETYSL